MTVLSAGPAFWVAVVAYAIAAALLFVVLAGKSQLRPFAVAFVLIAWLAHGTDIGWRGVHGEHPAESVREALGFLAFILTGGYLLASTRYRLTLGGVVVMPVSLILLVLARLTPAGEPNEDLSTLGRIHISLATLGVGIFALASALSAIYLAEDRALKRKKFEGAAFKDRGAPLESLDRLAHRLVWFGFPVFTIALVLGAMWTARLGQSPARVENLLAVITWFAFATLLLARALYGWRGRRAAKLTLGGFAAAIAVLVIYLVRRIVE